MDAPSGIENDRTVMSWAIREPPCFLHWVHWQIWDYEDLSNGGGNLNRGDNALIS